MEKNILSAIGNTPIVEINNLITKKNVRIYAKLEGNNPGGSIKDRIALKMIEEAEKNGQLTKEKTIIEPTSGNTGIGLALVAAVKGYNIEIVMSEAVSIERRKMLEAFGAHIILSPADEGTDGAIRLAKEMVRRSPHKYFMPNQFDNENNWKAHYEGTAEEIIKQLPKIDYFVAGLGTSGTLMGCSKRLKKYNKKINIIGVEPVKGHKIQGLKSLKEAEKPGIYDKRNIDKKIIVNDSDAYDTARKLISKEGLFVGMSSGAAMYGALKTAEKINRGNILVILPDRGEKYLSTSLFIKNKMGFRLFNTLTRQNEEFVPIVKGHVSMYSCGPTVYDYAHIGNFRSYIFADILKRYLKYKGYKVKHIMNITDVDDKTIKGSKKQGKTLKQFTDFYIKEFFRDIETLNIEKPDIVPRATETIGEMVRLIKKLLEKGLAYKGKDKSIYYDISKFKNYGKLAHVKIKELKPGARVKQDEYDKASASDFALWKAYSKEDGDVFWETELGRGRPGWHIECSAMSTKNLGENFDIHTGGVDLIFPHHENEIAQSEGATGKTFVNYWIHCEHLIVNGKKMSKSLGNFYTLRDILDKGYDPKAIRYALMATNYKQQLNFTLKGLDAAKNSVERLQEFIRKLDYVKEGKDNKGVRILINEVKEKFEDSMDDNLNISEALGAVFDFIRKVNKLIEDKRISSKNVEDIKKLMMKFDEVLGILEFKEEKIPAEIKKLIDEREKARKDKNYDKADKLRDEIKKKGYFVEDTKQGVRWKKIK
jgi:cysteinyl-tRNA synthetase